MIITPPPEPAIVKHIPLDTDGCCTICKISKMIQVMVEIDRFPNVQSDRADGRRMSFSSAEEAMEAACHGIEALPVRAIDPRTEVAVARLQQDLSGQQQFATADDLDAGEDSFRIVRVVAAPRGVHSPDFPVGERKSGHTDVQQGCSIGPGAALPAFPEVGTNTQRLPLRYPLLAPMPGEVQNFLGTLGQRKRDHAVV